ncbi:hypothetical protein E2C01_032095 [Portunus trituberculatus]|uniref:Uncharacterized protein n=1 Tax=Portunus trituberculatus TaxID=210409 RepID=A0A5B7EZN5_PORTR|nr:hypothetical protein [Portunus trituberculatus]
MNERRGGGGRHFKYVVFLLTGRRCQLLGDLNAETPPPWEREGEEAGGSVWGISGSSGSRLVARAAETGGIEGEVTGGGDLRGAGQLGSNKGAVTQTRQF